VAVPEPSVITIIVADEDISENTVYAQTSFTIAAAAQPGTCQIVVRDPDSVYDFVNGSIITARITTETNDTVMWRGFLFTVERGYAFPDTATRLWTLSGVDLNILLDKLIMYNHDHPTRYPDGDGTYKRERVVEGGVTYGYIVSVPRYTYDDDYIKAMVKDFDIGLVNPPIQISSTYIRRIGMINPDGNFTPPAAGTTLRNFLADVSTNVQRSTPGSTIWYVNPEGYLVYMEQDRDIAPFWVGDEDPTVLYNGVYGENVRDLRITRDISGIKNDVLVFTGTLDPSPGSSQDHLLYRHSKNRSSIDTYGRFQYAEVLNSDWLQGMVNVRASKILYQQGDPAQRCDFTTYRSGLYPGQLINVISTAHGITENFPIRSISMSFPLPGIVEYKRPVTRGLQNPNFNVIDRRAHPNLPVQPAEAYTLCKEYPRATGGANYACSYAYIRDSITVFVGGLRQVSVQDPESGTVGFLETSPDAGTFRLASTPTGGKKVYVEYHVWHNLDD
jgi:hypothetical protein